MSSWGQICPWHDISLAVVVERVDYLFKNQKHDSTITYVYYIISTSALWRRDVPPRAVHVKLFGLTQKGRMVGCLLFLSAWITHQKTHIHINYIYYVCCWFYLLQNRKYVFVMSGEKNQSELPEKSKERKKNQTMHSLVIIQLFFG